MLGDSRDSLLEQFQSCCVPAVGGAGIYACGIALEEIGFSH
jgi:hypothetical protein